jgi:hypothetical protein
MVTNAPLQQMNKPYLHAKASLNRKFWLEYNAFR